MKNLIYILLFSLVFVSCRSSKKAIESTTKQEIDTFVNKKDTANTVVNLSTNEASSLIDSITEITTTYDTSKPVDPATGRAPVSSESKKTDVKKTNTEKSTNKTTTKAQSSNTAAVVKQTNEAKETAKTEVNKKNIVQNFTSLVWSLIGLIIAAVSGYFIYKFYIKKK